MQIIDTININGIPTDLWQSNDAEGRKIYAITARKFGRSVQPEDCQAIARSRKAAIEEAIANLAALAGEASK
jgi:hypothetical protein